MMRRQGPTKGGSYEPHRNSGTTGGERRDMPARHLKAAQTHDDAALRHEDMALYWDEYGDLEHAELERRNIEIERTAAQLERDRADFIQRRRVAPTG